MKSFWYITFLLVVIILNFAFSRYTSNEYNDSDEADEDYEFDDFDNFNLEREDDVHIIRKKNDLRQVIFNPRKRRQRRLERRGNFQHFLSFK